MSREPVSAINHVQVAAPPELEAAAVAFYRDVLGLRPIPKTEGADSPRGGWFSAGNIELHVGIQEKGFSPAAKAHVAFMVPDLEALKSRLEKAGRPIRPGGEMPAYRRFFSEDPCGNRLEFMQKK
ncbi:MAG: VOC family protein [Planctomycetes bacterium]|nr:VOC family protein [Planctomycetota bacterium]